MGLKTKRLSNKYRSKVGTVHALQAIRSDLIMEDLFPRTSELLLRDGKSLGHCGWRHWWAIPRAG